MTNERHAQGFWQRVFFLAAFACDRGPIAQTDVEETRSGGTRRRKA